MENSFYPSLDPDTKATFPANIFPAFDAAMVKKVMFFSIGSVGLLCYDFSTAAAQQLI